MKNKNNFIISSLSVLLALSANSAFAQSNYKEASNAFALYTQTGAIKNLENAKKQLDNIYKTAKDSSKTRVNVLRAMVMSSIAYADSARTIKTDKDPIDLTYQTLGRIREKDREGYPGEISYVKQNLAAALIKRANKSLQGQKYDAAYNDFLKVDELNAKNEDVTYNLAVLANKAGKSEDAVKFYKKIIESGNATEQQYLELAALYDKLGESQLNLTTLENARTKYGENKEILFQLIQEYASVKAYDAIVPIADQAIKMEPDNVELNYLAGYANENANNIPAAKAFYEKVLELYPNNYESNLALGLIYLKDFLSDTENHEAQYNAQNFLLKANEIKPYEINALKSLAMFYEKADDAEQLDRVNLLLNQLTN
ncbi:tetratricopeptide repeat protein [Sphingobacterium hotanense]|uniref:tetratricopeptide repeat protein n=1 Tax=Sphingobacterium hotanense TaxID=649196 RepID=UPI0021A63F07|nr:tetratricopeptide repeat protein [Sphingobacterium hotanense]MCT1525789.1 hypothetical protein [Sphingobacterium hotanense]